MAEVYPRPKMNFLQRIDNFWYHYRWPFLFALVVLAFIGIALVQYLTRTNPDVSFLYVGPKALSEETCESIVSSASDRLAKDYNGDGKRTADIKTIQLSTDLDLLSPHQKAEADKSFQRYLEEILSGEDRFLLVSPAFYDLLCDSGALMSVYEIFGSWQNDGEYLYGLPLKDTPLYKTPGFRDLPDDTLICLKYAGEIISDLSAEDRSAVNDTNAEIFRKLCDH